MLNLQAVIKVEMKIKSTPPDPGRNWLQISTLLWQMAVRILPQTFPRTLRG